MCKMTKIDKTYKQSINEISSIRDNAVKEVKWISIFIYVAIIMIAFIHCDTTTKNSRSKTFQAKDNFRYTNVKGPFYADKFGTLFEKKQYAVVGKGETFDAQIYYDSIVILKIGDSIIEKPLAGVLDIATFTELECDNGTLFSKDKNHVYYSIVSSGGSDRVIVNEANPNTFKPLSDYQYGMDDNHIFYQSKMIRGLDIKKHEILYSLDKTDPFIDYIKDDKIVFYNGDTVIGADAKTFKLVEGQKWLAEDKNFKYACCGQRFE